LSAKCETPADEVRRTCTVVNHARESPFALLNAAPSFGYGRMAGTTLRIVPWGVEIDLNVSYRLRPSRVVQELLYPDFGFLTTMSWNKLFVSR